MKKEIIIFMGGQGTGKGTFSAIMRDTRKLNHIGTGALFRMLPKDSIVGQIIARGDLVPDSELFKLVTEKVDNSQDNLIDGFPRTLPQARWLIDKYADAFNIKVLFLNVSEEIMLMRIQKRMSGAKLNRIDDSADRIVRKRLDIFWRETMPAIEWLRDHGKVTFFDIDVSGPIDENMKLITGALAQ